MSGGIVLCGGRIGGNGMFNIDGCIAIWWYIHICGGVNGEHSM